MKPATNAKMKNPKDVGAIAELLERGAMYAPCGVEYTFLPLIKPVNAVPQRDKTEPTLAYAVQLGRLANCDAAVPAPLPTPQRVFAQQAYVVEGQGGVSIAPCEQGEQILFIEQILPGFVNGRLQSVGAAPGQVPPGKPETGTQTVGIQVVPVSEPPQKTSKQFDSGKQTAQIERPQQLIFHHFYQGQNLLRLFLIVQQFLMFLKQNHWPVCNLR